MSVRRKTHHIFYLRIFGFKSSIWALEGIQRGSHGICFIQSFLQGEDLLTAYCFELSILKFWVKSPVCDVKGAVSSCLGTHLCHYTIKESNVNNHKYFVIKTAFTSPAFIVHCSENVLNPSKDNRQDSSHRTFSFHLDINPASSSFRIMQLWSGQTW